MVTLSQPLNLSELLFPLKSPEWLGLDNCQDPLMRQERHILLYHYAFYPVSFLPCAVPWRTADNTFTPPPFSFSLHFASTTLYNWFWICLPIGIIRRWLFTILGIGFCWGVGARGETPWIPYWTTNIWQRGVHFHKTQNEGTWFCWLLSHSSEFTEIYIWGVSSFAVTLKTILINALVYMALLMDFFFLLLFY